MRDASTATGKPKQAVHKSRDELRHRIHGELIETLGPALAGKPLSDASLRQSVTAQLQAVLAKETTTALTAADRARLLQDVADDIFGYGPIQGLLADPDITEVMVNGPGHVYAERGGRIERAGVTFVDESHLRRIIDKIVGEVGRRIDEATPMVDARLPDGSRVNAVVHPLAIGGPFLTIRKFAKDPYTIQKLIDCGTLDADVARLLEACVAGRLNLIISGGTGAGKTTLLNVLSGLVPPDERIITIEDAKELQLSQEHVLSMESRPPNIEGKGEVTIRDLVRNALRMRPDRIVVGECRGGEALDMLQAMNTGHEGSLTTVHSNSPRDTLARVETMTLMAGFDLPVRVIREQMASVLHLIVHLTRLRDGSRRVSHVTEVQGMEGEVIVLQDLFLFDYAMGIDQDGRYQGRLKSTGVRPRFETKLADHGITLPNQIFANGGFTRWPTRRL